ncbi:MAG: hypothetical protein ABJA20_11015 [Novosphingobium sp.]
MVGNRAGGGVMTEYLIFFAIVLGVNLMPAFGPPTWSIIVLYTLNYHLPVAALVIVGALAAASGRFLLALGFRHMRRFVPARTKNNLEAAGKAIHQRKTHTFLGLGLFALSPLPSAQLFEAAGLIGVRLIWFTAAFFSGRLVSYTIYGMSAKAIKASSLGDAFRNALASPLAIGLQIGMIVLIVWLSQIDWAKHLGNGDGKDG